VGNPLTSEVAAFRWLIAILIAAGTVALVAKVFGSIPGIYYGMFLLLVLAGFIVKGMIHMLGSPDEEEQLEEELEAVIHSDQPPEESPNSQ
jgi:hypothetical protein